MVVLWEQGETYHHLDRNNNLCNEEQNFLDNILDENLHLSVEQTRYTGALNVSSLDWALCSARELPEVRC
jgi:hypothetical protein